MATPKKPTRYLSGKVDLKATFSQLRDKKETRGPGQIGQQRNLFTVRLGKIAQPQLMVRLAAAKSVLETGKVPAAVKGGSDKAIKLKKDLDAALARIVELESSIVPNEGPPTEASEEKPEIPPDGPPDPDQVRKN